MDDKDSQAFADAIVASINSQQSSRPSRAKRAPLKYQDAVDSLKDVYTEEQLSSEYPLPFVIRFIMYCN